MRVGTILAFVPNWLGDVAMCTPALRALHQTYPGAKLVVVGRPAACDLLNGLPWLHAAIPILDRPGVRRVLLLGQRLRRYAADIAVVFPHSFRAALIARLAGARRRLAYDRGGRAFLLTHAIPPHRENGRIQAVYMAREYLDLVSHLGCTDDGAGLELRAQPGVVEQVKRHLRGKGPLVGLAPGAAFGPSKRWPAESYAAVANALAERTGARCVVLTGPGEENLRDTIAAKAKTSPIQCDEGHPTVETLKATIAQLDLLICNDSGPRHVAVAFKVPTLCLMGPTLPCYTDSPYEVGRVLRADVECAGCHKSVCPEDHRCMTRIHPDQVVAAATQLLAKSTPRPAVQAVNP